MTLHKTFFALSVALGLTILGGCGGNNTESATNVPGPPAGPQPGAATAGATAGATDNNAER